MSRLIRVFAKARDLDTLRFRADSRINEIIHNVARDTASAGVGFVDVVEIIERSSLHGVAGEQFFWEHVHMNFAGNYLLARSILDEVAKMLPDWVRKEGTGGQVPSEAECGERLAHTTWDRRRIANKMIAVVETPPFTNQLYHFEHVSSMRRQLGELEVYKEQYRIEADRAAYRDAIDRAKDDSWLYFNYGIFLQKVCREPQASADALRTACRRMPQYAAAYNQLGVAVNQLGQTAEAVEYLSQAIRLLPDFVQARMNLDAAMKNLEREKRTDGDANGLKPVQ